MIGSTWRRWRAERVSLAGFSGRGVRLRFRLVTDADPLSVDEGWSLDDIRIGPGGALDGRLQAGEPAQAGAEVTLLQLSPDTGHWRVWAGAGQVNPQTTDAARRALDGGRRLR